MFYTSFAPLWNVKAQNVMNPTNNHPILHLSPFGLFLDDHMTKLRGYIRGGFTVESQNSELNYTGQHQEKERRKGKE